MGHSPRFWFTDRDEGATRPTVVSMDQMVASVQNYAWGDPAFIPELQRRQPSGQPEAELWMGAHVKAPSKLRSTGQSLHRAIADDPEGTLGRAAAFGELPFLMKVLAAAQPLSIQTHPNAQQAKTGFIEEEGRGVPIDGPTRTYRDDNHKPELIVALTPFDAKCGFRDLAQTRELFATLSNSQTAPIVDRLNQSGTPDAVLADVLQWLLSGEDLAIATTMAVVEACTTVGDTPWLNDILWTHRLHALYPGDPGIIVALLLNHFTLEPGEALFLEAGVLHSYVQGAGVEIMANSDNVIRGGLTTKHIDTVQLSKIAVTEPSMPTVQRPSGDVHTYDTPVSEFSLSRVVTNESFAGTVTGPEVLVATDGDFHLRSGDQTIAMPPGRAVWIRADDNDWVAEGHGTFFRAQVPVS